ncbi:MAG: Na+ dependent nucleoside transporter [Flavobacteriales bacterium]|nr:Na+ dependent nucleoside transporter [Flavobacteriales bacterium]
MRAILGILVFTALMWLFSTARKSVAWRTIIGALALQFAMAILVLKVPFINAVFRWIAETFVQVIGYTWKGTDFLLGRFSDGQVGPYLENFAFRILATIVFFSALSALLHHLGILSFFIRGFAWVMRHTLRLTGRESLSVAGNVFLGQTESPLLIRPYLDRMSRSELMLVMTGGMATIAGSVFAAYVGILGGTDPETQAYFATHLLTASLISAPASVAAAKLLVPETEPQVAGDAKIVKSSASNFLEAITNGTRDGLSLAANVGVMLLVFTAFVYMFNDLLGWVGGWSGINAVLAANTSFETLSMECILGYIGAPIAWLVGVSSEDIVVVGQLLGEKTVINEFYAYETLGKLKGGMSDRSVLISTYILCGFANFASIGIQVGGIGVLAPSRRGELAQLGFRALIAGTAACLLTACVISIMHP